MMSTNTVIKLDNKNSCHKYQNQNLYMLYYSGRSVRTVVMTAAATTTTFSSSVTCAGYTADKKGSPWLGAVSLSDNLCTTTLPWRT